MDEVTRRFNNKDELAFELFFKVHYHGLVQYAVTYTNDFHEAEDIVLISYSKLWGSKTMFADYKEIRFYMYRVVRNECLNYIKSVKRRWRQAKELSGVEPDASDTGSSLTDKLYDCIRSLPAHYAKLLLLDLQGYTNKEVSKLTGIKTTTIETKKWRAMKMLTALLKTKL